LPAFAAALWAMKDLAPTRLRWAGAAAGLLAGTLGAAAYSLHCPELAAPFLALWYVLGMLIPAGVGALVGPRVLGW
ncbi:MAG: NrsF family protein, partial [Rhodocyclaceae bacterium]